MLFHFIRIFLFPVAFFFFGVSIVQAQQLLVKPYLQPGNTSNLSKEQKVLIWQTDNTTGDFKVVCGPGASVDQSPKLKQAKISFDRLTLDDTTLLYRASLAGLKFDETYSYRVTLKGKVVAEATFNTRTKLPKTRFAVFGDCGAGTPEQAAIAYQVYQQKPQFVLVTGDNVYERGREKEYRKNFFPYYDAATASPETGAPLLRSIPFYMLIGNHDVYSDDLDKYQDGLAYFFYNDLPLNAPAPASTVEARGDAERVKSFEKLTRPRFPRMTNFSFDYGNVHITCLDANDYINPLDPTLMQWFINDIRSSRAEWKIVAFHHPGFNSSKAHYDYQRMRLLSPIMEELGVDMVLTGHVHNYQRTVPLKFEPKKDESGERYIVSDEGRVDGKFSLDADFDGQTNTIPNGIIYIITGAGGRALYDVGLSRKPELWKHEPATNWVPFTAKLESHIHSYTMIETDGKTLVITQYDLHGNTLDSITITK